MTAPQTPGPSAVPRGGGAGPLTPEAAAWIREHAWKARMRATYAEVPGFFTTCACQHGPSTWCATGKCGNCHRGTPLREYAAVICWPGDRPAYFAEPYRHETGVSATGPRYEHLAMVWLADRVCRWVCPHDCHATVQLDLFEEVA